MKFDEVHLGDIRFNATTRELTFEDGRPAQLRNQSKEVLRFLVNNPSRTVTKDEIIEAVWPDVTVSDESLVQCIADIRRVIGKDAKRIVDTVPREGYRMQLPAEIPVSDRSILLPSLIKVQAKLPQEPRSLCSTEYSGAIFFGYNLKQRLKALIE